MWTTGGAPSSPERVSSRQMRQRPEATLPGSSERPLRRRRRGTWSGLRRASCGHSPTSRFQTFGTTNDSPDVGPTPRARPILGDLHLVIDQRGSANCRQAESVKTVRRTFSLLWKAAANDALSRLFPSAPQLVPVPHQFPDSRSLCPRNPNKA